MKKICITFGFSLLAIIAAVAQNNPAPKNTSGIALSLGAAANYYYGPGDRNFGKFENDRVNWQLNGMVGLTLARDKNGHRTMAAGFGALGFNNASTVKQILSDQKYLSSALNQSSSNNFYQLEGGLLIAEVLRISTGIGQQNFDGQALVSSNGTILTNARSLRYNSTTVGFNLNFNTIALIINANFAYGQDYVKTVITPSAGLMLRF